MINFRFITVDGSDGSGKTSQLKLLKHLFDNAGIPTYSTRLLGGDGTDFTQNELRKLLLDPAFPADSVEDEERLFAATDLRGLKLTRKWLTENPTGVAFMDRGLASHIVYAMAKDMSRLDILNVHHDVVRAYERMALNFGMVSVIMVPEDERMAMDRVIARGEQVTPRLENTATQKAVIDGMTNFDVNSWIPGYLSGHELHQSLLVVKRTDSIAAVAAMLREKLSVPLKGFGL